MRLDHILRRFKNIAILGAFIVFSGLVPASASAENLKEKPVEVMAEEFVEVMVEEYPVEVMAEELAVEAIDMDVAGESLDGAEKNKTEASLN